MESAEFGELKINVDESPDRVVAEWTGKSAARDPGVQLGPFLKGIAERAQPAGRTVEMRFESLSFFNSSTITVIIQFVQEMRERRQRLIITFDAKQRWQRVSFDALRIFEKGDGLLELRAIG